MENNMWLTQKEEDKLDIIFTANSLTPKEIKTVKIYRGFKKMKAIKPECNGVNSHVYYELQDILKKYS